MIPFYFPTISKDFKKIKNVLKSTYISEGKVNQTFEKELKKFLEIKYCVTVNSGTSALHLSLVAAGIQQGDEVILSPQTFISTGLAILYLKAIPVFADVQTKTGNICTDSVRKLITKKTKAIISVDWSGYPCDYDELIRICRNKKIKLIEDAAHAFGAKYKKKSIGNIADFTCFSFQATKHLTTGDGGMIACKNKSDYTNLYKLRFFGIDKNKNKIGKLGDREYVLDQVGFKYHLNDFSASLGLSNLRLMKNLLDHHRKIGKYYMETFSQINGISLMNYKKNREHSFWFFQFLVEGRNNFVKKIKSLDIPCSIVNHRIDKHKIFFKFKNSNLPNLNFFEKNKISLPVHIKVSKRTVDKIVKNLSSGW